MLTLAGATLGAGVASACVRASPASRGNQVVPVATSSPDDEQLKPRGWHMSKIKVGGGFNSLTSIHFLQNLQLPAPAIPYVTSMMFYAPEELPLVTIGLYYEAGSSPAVHDILTSAALGLQPISDPDWPLHWDTRRADPLAGDLSAEQLAWFKANRGSIVESMRQSAQGLLMSKKYDCDFTSRLRPPANTPAALVISGGTYSGVEFPSTVIAQRLLFVD